jgi:hypothetical protein
LPLRRALLLSGRRPTGIPMDGAASPRRLPPLRTRDWPAMSSPIESLDRDAVVDHTDSDRVTHPLPVPPFPCANVSVGNGDPRRGDARRSISVARLSWASREAGGRYWASHHNAAGRGPTNQDLISLPGLKEEAGALSCGCADGGAIQSREPIQREGL